MIKTSMIFAGIALAGGLTAAPALAGNYPEQPITVIVPSKAGGSTDRTARLFTELAEKNFEGVHFVIQDIPGSGGQKGFEAIARAQPDGYTIGLNFTPQLVAHVVSQRAQYTLDSFHVMGNVAQDPGIVVVPADSDIMNMADLAAAGAAGSLTVAVNGIGSDDFLAAKQFEAVANVTFNLLPTNGSTEQKAAVLGGHVDAAFMNLSQMIKQHMAGDARIIALLTTQRDEHLPDVGTSAEQGFDVEMRATRGFIAPSGIPDDIQAKLDSMLAEIMASDEFKANAAEGNIFLLPMDGMDYLSYLTDLQTQTQAVYEQAPW